MAMGVGLEPTASGLTGLIFYNLIAESVFFILHIYYNIFFKKNQIFHFSSSCVLRYNALKIYNRYILFDFYISNSHLCLAKNIGEAAAASFSFSSYSLPMITITMGDRKAERLKFIIVH